MARFRRAIAKGIILLIKLYQYGLSPVLGNRCRFYPNCSLYTELSILQFGILKGLYFSVLRLIKCHPWHEGGIDFPPTKE